MSVVVSCACGKQLRVQDQYIGKRIQCPACGTVQTVEGGAGEMLPDTHAEPNMLRFECGNCGKPMQARVEHAGRQTRCPGCQSVVTIKGDAYSSHSEPRRSGFSRVPNLQRAPNPAIWGYLTAALMLLVVLVGVGVYFLMNPGGFGGDMSVTDLDLIPADAQGVICVRVAEGWKKPLVQQIVQASPILNNFNQRMLNDPNQIGAAGTERFTIVMQDNANDLVWGAFLLNRPLDPTRFHDDLEAQAFDKHAVTKYVAAKPYYLVKLPNQGFNFGAETLAFSLYHPKLVIFGIESEIVKVLERGKNVTKDGPMADILKRAAGNEALVAGFAFPPEVMADLAEVMKQQVDVPCEAIADIKKILLIGTIDQNVDFEVSATLPDGMKAMQVKTTLEAGKNQLMVMLGFAKFGIPATMRPLIVPAEAALKKSTITQADKEVKVKISLEGPALVNMARQLGAMQGMRN